MSILQQKFKVVLVKKPLILYRQKILTFPAVGSSLALFSALVVLFMSGLESPACWAAPTLPPDPLMCGWPKIQERALH